MCIRDRVIAETISDYTFRNGRVRSWAQNNRKIVLLTSKDVYKRQATGFECGIGIERFNDIKEGDIIENYLMVQI